MRRCSDSACCNLVSYSQSLHGDPIKDTSTRVSSTSDRKYTECVRGSTAYGGNGFTDYRIPPLQALQC